MATAVIDGAIRYPDDLPCPHADTDLTPRERRYISDIGEVKKLRRFQSTFQATRQNISFVFTPEQAQQFQQWYKYSILEGGAWFYADWPILHKEKGISYRFVTRPVWEFLARGNYHVSATVELYEGRKIIAAGGNIYTSKLYPYIFVDNIGGEYTFKGNPYGYAIDDIGAAYSITSGSMRQYYFGSYKFGEDIGAEYSVVSGSMRQYTYGAYSIQPDDIQAEYSITSGEMGGYLISYNYWDDDIQAEYSITSGEIT